ncbi:hypothetical protein JMJ77_0014674, partial [Colletotrichum scovillei]
MPTLLRSPIPKQSSVSLLNPLSASFQTFKFHFQADGSRLSRSITSINHQRRPSHKRTPATSQVQNTIGNLLWTSHPLHRHRGRDSLLHRLQHLGVLGRHWCLCVSRADGIDAQALVGIILGCSARQTNDGVLRRRHNLRRRPQHVERSVDVHVKNPLPVFRLGERGAALVLDGDAGGVDNIVQPAKLGCCFIDDLDDFFLVGDIDG